VSARIVWPHSRTLAFSRSLIRLAGALTPAARRAAWREEWEAELWRLWRDGEQESDASRARSAVRFSAGAFRHALDERRRQPIGDSRMATVLVDLQFALRLIRRRPVAALAVVLSLALGVGANAAVYSIVQAVLLRPLPYVAPDELVMVWEHNISRDRQRNVVSPGNFLAWRDEHQGFARFDAFADFSVNLTGVGEPEEIPTQAVTGGIFALLGVPAAVGRTIVESDDLAGAPQAAVLSDRLWRRRFAADPGVIGRSVTISARSVTIVGVMPPGFNILNPRTDLWLAFQWDERARTPQGRYLRTVARLKPGVTIEAAQAEMKTISARTIERFPDFNTGWSVNTVPLHEQAVGEARTGLLVLLGAAGFVLLIGAANAANLMLASASERRREIAVRQAMGAGRGRLLQQLLAESALLGLMAGGVGLAIGWAALTGLGALLGDATPIPRLHEVRLDWLVFGVIVTISLAAGLAAGGAAAVRASRSGLNDALRDGARGTAGSRDRRLRAGFVVAQTALALALLVGAGLLLRSLANLLTVNPASRDSSSASPRSPAWSAPAGSASCRSRVSGRPPRSRSWGGRRVAAATCPSPTCGSSRATISAPWASRCCAGGSSRSTTPATRPG
jgi:predicted permease